MLLFSLSPVKCNFHDQGHFVNYKTAPDFFFVICNISALKTHKNNCNKYLYITATKGFS